MEQKLRILVHQVNQRAFVTEAGQSHSLIALNSGNPTRERGMGISLVVDPSLTRRVTKNWENAIALSAGVTACPHVSVNIY